MNLTHRLRRLLLLTAVAVVAVAAACAPSARADVAALAGAPSKEYQVKAAFLFNFVQFVEWPDASFPAADAPYVLAVVGDSPFQGALEQAVGGKTVNGRRLVVRYFPTPADIGPCHLLFVCRSEDGRASQVFDKIEGRPVLTVGETDAFARAGGGIRFLAEDNKVRFAVNLRATERARIKISSKLLKLAKTVQR